MRNKYTDAEIKTLLKNICIIVDTREQVWGNIEEYFKKNNIQYRREKLNQGDYSACLVSNEETMPLGVIRDMYFDNEIVIERKASIDELAGNMKEPDRTRLKKEFSYLKSRGTKIHFFMEEPTLDEEIKHLTLEEKEELKVFLKKMKAKNVILTPAGFDYNLRFERYRSQYKAKALNGSIKDFETTFGFTVRPLKKEIIGSEIYNTLHYHIKNRLLGK